MSQTSPNSYLHQYQQKKQTSKSRSQGKVIPKGNSPQQIEGQGVIGNIVGRLQERVDGLEVKIKSLVSVVTLLQRYTETKDDQYQKQKEQEFQRAQLEHNCMNCVQTQTKIRQFDILTSQFKEELKNLQKIKNTATFAPQSNFRLDSQENFQELILQQLQDKLRAEINKKMEICIKLINNKDDKQVKTLTEKVNDISFSLNQLQNECKRNRMMFEKDVDNLTALLKQTSTQVPNNHSRITEREVLSKSPLQVLPKSKSKNSKSDNSISRGKHNRVPVFPKDVSRLRDDELKQALRKKKEHKQKLKSKNW